MRLDAREMEKEGRTLIEKAQANELAWTYENVVDQVFESFTPTSEALQALAHDGLVKRLTGYVSSLRNGNDNDEDYESGTEIKSKSGKTATSGIRGVPGKGAKYRAMTRPYFSITQNAMIPLNRFTADDFTYLAKTLRQKAEGMTAHAVVAETSAATLRKAKATTMNDLSETDKRKLNRLWEGVKEEE